MYIFPSCDCAAEVQYLHLFVVGDLLEIPEELSHSQRSLS